jgi:hypothetical protein
LPGPLSGHSHCQAICQHAQESSILYSDPSALNKWGFLYVQFRATAYYYILPVLGYIQGNILLLRKALVPCKPLLWSSSRLYFSSLQASCGHGWTKDERLQHIYRGHQLLERHLPTGLHGNL